MSSLDGPGSNSPPVTKRPRTARGLSSRLHLDAGVDLEDSNTSEDCAIFTSRVTRMFVESRAAPKPVEPVDSKQPHMAEKGESNMSRTKTKKRVTRGSAAAAQLPADASPSTDAFPLWDADNSEPLVLEAKEPTPPPTPSDSSPNPRTRRKPARRVKKAVKVAMNKLEKAQHFLDDNEADKTDDEDVMIVDGPNAIKSPSKNRSIEVKIRCRFGVHRQQMRLTDSFADVISLIAAKENMSDSDIIMFLNDRTVHAYDSPKSLGLTVADIIECHLRGSVAEPATVSQSSATSVDDDLFLVRLVLQSTDSRTTKCTMSIAKDEPMDKLMRDYCSQVGVKYGSVVFQFDGERVDLSATPDSLELESDYCIDVLPC